ncbi:hypothetical protein OOU_Y34scaffold01019g5 [Pyricularia oryzae Y34]|uniref:Uncharacterized protein n=1 Tax=Pyricularia oryzae (strain Y34) TaxID=1143189 RepID=A0AA97PFN9_PYRO3|nr:hypothetical protein OOU_Y34scaffold01019g5 [Pyricularia oryzae Y34]
MRLSFIIWTTARKESATEIYLKCISVAGLSPNQDVTVRSRVYIRGIFERQHTFYSDIRCQSYSLYNRLESRLSRISKARVCAKLFWRLDIDFCHLKFANATVSPLPSPVAKRQCTKS